MPREALEFFAKLQKLSRFPSHYACNRHLHRLTTGSLGDVALKLLCALVSRGFRPDISALNSAVSLLARNGGPRSAQAFVDAAFPVLGCTPDVVTFNSLVDGYCRADDLLGASVILRSMQSCGPRPDVVTYNT
ncbi:pentatricopeptide repeat-containing protein At2g01740-like [Musa acuminata AAA Group]|uniref:pentatricopeptide repeat-containing protein At2g01740-like n=1 Tax=Musa acuminata AAA Group TaxID=214697 RepID=UPI0031DEE7A5